MDAAFSERNLSLPNYTLAMRVAMLACLRLCCWSLSRAFDENRNSKPMTHIAVVIPIYNSAASLEELIDRLKVQLGRITDDFKIILVDDRGREPVWPIIQSASIVDTRVCGIRLSRNFGQHPAITAGMDHAHADWVVVMDGDLQDRPEDVPRLYEHAVQNDHQIVIAERQTSALGWRRTLGSRIFNGILRRVSGLNLSHKYGNFRIFTGTVADAFRQYKEQMRLFPAIFDQIGFEPAYLLLGRDERPQGKSSYSLKKLIKLAFEAMIAYSAKPLIYLAMLGLIITVISAAFAVFVLARALFFGSEITGWPSLMVAVTFFGGFQLFVTSFVGVYVGEVFKEAKGRPVYLIEDKSNL